MDPGREPTALASNRQHFDNKVTGNRSAKKRLISKESGPRKPGFDFSPEGWRLPLDVQWNDGMVE
jgi:hypothetical protein